VTPRERLQKARGDLVALRADIVEALGTERSRRRSSLNRMLHEVDAMLFPGHRYLSQAGQDRSSTACSAAVGVEPSSTSAAMTAIPGPTRCSLSFTGAGLDFW